MKGKVVLAVLAMTGILALSATVAQAGNGGSPTPLTSFFVCRTINGDDPARSVDVISLNNDQSNQAGWNFAVRGVRLGNATLACAFARLFTPAPPNQLVGTTSEINPQTTESKFEDLKCYAVSVPRSQTLDPIIGTPLTGTPPSYMVTDNLFGLDPNVTGSAVTYICAPARFSPQ